MQLPLTGSVRNNIIRPGIPRINWNHPLAKYLVAAYLPGICPYDITGNNGPLTYASDAAFKVTSEGLAYQCVNLTSAQAGPKLLTNSNMTMYWRGLLVNNITFKAMFNIADSSAFNTYWGIWGWDFGASAPAAVWNGSRTECASGTGGYTTGVVQSATATYPSSHYSNASGCYANAVYSDNSGGGSTGFAASTLTEPNAKLFLSAGSGGMTCQHLMALVFNTNFNDQQVLALDKQPYDLFIWPEDELLSTLTATVAAPPIIVGSKAPLIFRPGTGPYFGLNTTLAETTSIAYSISAAQGTYTLTGQSQTLGVGVNATQGTYTLTGQLQTLAVGMPTTQGAYTLTGQDQTLAVGMPAAQGTYTLTGQAQTLKQGKGIAATQGVYTLTGQAQGLNPSLLSTEGSYNVTGSAVTLTKTKPITAVSGTYTLTGQAQTLNKTLSIVATKGAYTLTGNATVLTKQTPGSGPGQSLGGKFIADVGSMMSRSF